MIPVLAIADQGDMAARARAEAEKCARRIRICIDAGEFEEANRQVAEAKRFMFLALTLTGAETEASRA